MVQYFTMPRQRSCMLKALSFCSTARDGWFIAGGRHSASCSLELLGLQMKAETDGNGISSPHLTPAAYTADTLSQHLTSSSSMFSRKKQAAQGVTKQRRWLYMKQSAPRESRAPQSRLPPVFMWSWLALIHLRAWSGEFGSQWDKQATAEVHSLSRARR